MARIKISKAKLWQAIRTQCLTCVGGSAKEVTLCTDPACSLYPYRLGQQLTYQGLKTAKETGKGDRNKIN